MKFCRLFCTRRTGPAIDPERPPAAKVGRFRIGSRLTIPGILPGVVLFPTHCVRAPQPVSRGAPVDARNFSRMIRNTPDSWGAAAKFFHWTTAVLVFAQIVLGWAAVSWRFSPMKAHLYVWHKSLGIALLAWVLLRLMWRFVNPTPALPCAMPAWETRCARMSYMLLYAVLIAMPITGWILNSAANVPRILFSSITGRIMRLVSASGL